MSAMSEKKLKDFGEKLKDFGEKTQQTGSRSLHLASKKVVNKKAWAVSIVSSTSHGWTSDLKLPLLSGA